MRRPLIIAASLLIAGTAAVAQRQQPLGAPGDGEGRKDPSFPQPGVMEPAGSSSLDGGKIGIGSPPPPPPPPPAKDGMITNLADRLTVEKRAGLWWDYARDVVSVAARLVNPERTTLLVPINEAMMKLDRKPHQNTDGSPASDDEAKNNVDRFVAAHVVPGDVEFPTTKPKKTLLKGLSVEVVKVNNGWVVKPGDIPVLEIQEVSNGRILFLDAAVPYSSQ